MKKKIINYSVRSKTSTSQRSLGLSLANVCPILSPTDLAGRVLRLIGGTHGKLWPNLEGCVTEEIVLLPSHTDDPRVSLRTLVRTNPRWAEGKPRPALPVGVGGTVLCSCGQRREEFPQGVGGPFPLKHQNYIPAGGLGLAYQAFLFLKVLCQLWGLSRLKSPWFPRKHRGLEPPDRSWARLLS